MAQVDINRGNISLPESVSEEIWGATVEGSAIAQLANQIELPGNGAAIPMIASEPDADWVEETAAKPVATHGLAKKVITPYKLAVIEPVSTEFLRDAGKLFDELVARLPMALARKFDNTIISTNAPGSNFDTLGDCTAVSIASDTYSAFLAADSAISTADGIMSGIALAPQGKSIVLGALDGQGRPLFTPGVESGTLGNILGASVTVAKGVYAEGSPNVVGIAGDWSDARYGTVEGVKIDVSRDATLATADGTINLFQQNMVAIRCEIEIGFAVRDKAEFVLLTD